MRQHGSIMHPREQASFQGFLFASVTKLVFDGSSWNPVFHYNGVFVMFRVRDAGLKVRA
jgi:hypothetical protein